MTNQFPNISKWTMNPYTDNELSNVFWHNPMITDAQNTNILKFRTDQYMGMQENNYFSGEKDFPQ